MFSWGKNSIVDWIGQEFLRYFHQDELSPLPVDLIVINFFSLGVGALLDSLSTAALVWCSCFQGKLDDFQATI